MKVAVITGVSSGIGLATTKIFLRNRYRIYGISRRQPQISHKNLIWLKADLASSSKIGAVLNHITENRIDVLINNAGTSVKQKIDEININSFKLQFDLNFLAPIFLVQKLRHKLGGGLVINVSSIFAQMPMTGYGFYCASKSALNSYFTVFALEHKDIKIINIMPDAVDTPLLRKLVGPDFDLKQTIKSDQIGQVLYQLSGENDQFKSGSQIIIVNHAQMGDVQTTGETWVYNSDKDACVKIK